jgi:hypothetical protein
MSFFHNMPVIPGIWHRGYDNGMGIAFNGKYGNNKIRFGRKGLNVGSCYDFVNIYHVV